MQKLVNNPLIVIIITILAGILFFSLDKNAQKAEVSISTVQNLQQETDKINQEVTELNEKLQDAGTPLAEERIIRNELLMQKPGEFVVQLAAFKEIPETITPVQVKITPWEKWKKILFS